MKITLLDRASIGMDTPLDTIRKIGELTVYDNTPPELVSERIVDSDVIIINKIKITRDILEQARSLRLICIFATGYDSIDVNAARELGIGVCNVPGYSTASVTAVTVATVLTLLTRLSEYSAYTRSGEYSRSGMPNKLTPVFHDLTGKTWGIVGCGAIGSAVARVAEAFGARIITYQRHKHPKYETVMLDELCERSDVITIHCPLNEQSRSIINARSISLMKKNVILVNSARGGVLNESDVADAVRAGRISGFGCDVYSVEPFGEDHPYYSIRELDSVILTPHCAWGSYEARVKCINDIADNILSFIQGKFKNRVDI